MEPGVVGLLILILLIAATVGVLVPQLEMYGDVFWRAAAGDKAVALTFDDGPHPTTTRQILDILERRGHKATFFMVGQEVRARPEIAREVLAAGHAIGNHSWSHPSRPRDPIREIQRTDAALKSIGVRNTIFRPH